MAQGRGNSAMIALMLLFCTLMFHSDIAHATNFKVGDSGGWTFNVVNWPSGKTFKAGDILEFNYDTQAHNVVVVNEGGYNSCSGSSGEVHNSGKDQLKLKQGKNYFICSKPGHCQGGMKIAVSAA
ncbi:hypothetical protein TanjilG_00921 [Lupinus angustifolius]|uniref:Basic blue protein n=1 Tax=Lupinus angustifolius TaxID=3871 RepID=A0A4P1QQU3_LUPAN|nr:PREDICTED: basic blue protein-like [Lupinus angustifolius]OIV92787.1 hypothetical protein TanjilG_00921 [Lupinus angustifolius]